MPTDEPFDVADAFMRRAQSSRASRPIERLADLSEASILALDDTIGEAVDRWPGDLLRMHRFLTHLHRHFGTRADVEQFVNAGLLGSGALEVWDRVWAKRPHVGGAFGVPA